jgi:hypothetical protein
MQILNCESWATVRESSALIFNYLMSFVSSIAQSSGFKDCVENAENLKSQIMVACI